MSRTVTLTLPWINQLLLNKKGTIQEIADQTYFAWRSVQDVLFEMGHSSVIHFPEAKKGRVYYIDSDPWMHVFLNNTDMTPRWVCWSALFRAFELIWMKLNEPGFMDGTSLEQAADIKQLMQGEVIPRLVKSGFGDSLAPLSGLWCVEYLENWLLSIKAILQNLNSVQAGTCEG